MAVLVVVVVRQEVAQFLEELEIHQVQAQVREAMEAQVQEL